MSKHLCRDCGATEADGATFETRPGGRVKRLVCSDCIAAARAPTPKPTTLPVTRASYRAAPAQSGSGPIRPRRSAGAPPMAGRPRFLGKRAKPDDARQRGLPLVAAMVRTCRVCGCTDDDCRQRVAPSDETIRWVAADLCSACEEREAA